ncbi:fungal-specific transcription factor domain-containing protein [Cristinia sonorae]|uniref:Fungal-specific transcription factor domain-containing protein n=1 Tax=Cristinia sonorae TaxID=1940300 RepID=A0A8K0UVD4_9AGAR|nr:fungal-specific transcription factor domain-containing protein [Cristinia sonorae]
MLLPSFPGTTASCYQGQDVDQFSRNDDQVQARVDPGIEFNRIRLSLSLLESFIYQNPSLRAPSATSPISSSPTTSRGPVGQPPLIHPHRKEHLDVTLNGRHSEKGKAPQTADAPGMLGQQGSSGFYAGPTSAMSHLLAGSDKEDSDTPEVPRLFDRVRNDLGHTPPLPVQNAYDDELVALLPPVHTIDGLVEYYFEYCNWIYRHVNQPTFMEGWSRFKSGQNGDRIVLATVCMIIALSVRYLPPGHALFASLAGSCEEIGSKYYRVMLESLSRHRQALRKDNAGKGYTLELIELLLIRCHYLTFAKEDPEETWSVKGELVSIGTAMGLHRDPSRTRFDRAVAERRRWAWWHIILLERWQAFMFGRPLAISSHHFNTRFPSYCDPELDPTGRLYLPNIALFKLAYILGDIMNDAVSFRAVPYSSIQESDRSLVHWEENLPQEMDLDEYRIARSLASPVTSLRRTGVQSVIIRTAYYHIRFTLHRPYAHIPTSLETAVNAAGKLIALVGQTRPDFLSNTSLAVPGHMNWGPFHIFSAAMFFSFQLISHPDQPAGKLFRENIKKAIACLEQSRWMPVGDKALTILQALAPLYSEELGNDPPDERERKKGQVLNLVKTLAFPYQDTTYARTTDSPGYTREQYSQSSSPDVAPQPVYDSHPQHTSVPGPPQHPISSVRWVPGQSDVTTTTSSAYPPSTSSGTSRHPPYPHSQHQPYSSLPSHNTHTQPAQHSPTSLEPPHSSHPELSGSGGVEYASSMYALPSHHGAAASMHHQQQMEMMGPPDMPYMHPADESSMWGASIGFGLGEWAQFLNAMQRSDTNGNGMKGGGH